MGAIHKIVSNCQMPQATASSSVAKHPHPAVIVRSCEQAPKPEDPVHTPNEISSTRQNVFHGCSLYMLPQPQAKVLIHPKDHTVTPCVPWHQEVVRLLVGGW